MPTTSLTARFDGQAIQLDEPFELPRDTPLLITILPTETADSETSGTAANSSLSESRRSEIERWIHSASTTAEALDDSDDQALQSAVTEIRRQARELARRAETSL